MSYIENFFLRLSGEIEEQRGIRLERQGDVRRGRILEEEGRARKKIAEIRMFLDELIKQSQSRTNAS